MAYSGMGSYCWWSTQFHLWETTENKIIITVILQVITGYVQNTLNAGTVVTPAAFMLTVTSQLSDEYHVIFIWCKSANDIFFFNSY